MDNNIIIMSHTIFFLYYYPSLWYIYIYLQPLYYQILKNSNALVCQNMKHLCALLIDETYYINIEQLVELLLPVLYV